MRYNGGMEKFGWILGVIFLLFLIAFFLWGGTLWIRRELQETRGPAKTETFDDQSGDQALKDARDEWCETHICKD